MIKYLILSFRRGIIKIKENPQLAYTLFTAVVIFFAFLFTSNNFLIIAKDAQERLINARAGSIHDVFSEFAFDYIDNPEFLSSKIKEISEKNKTISEFKVVVFDNNQRVVIASLKEDEVNSIDDNPEVNFLYNLAWAQKNQPFTKEIQENGERFFETVQAISDDEGTVVGAVYTKQTLSQADKQLSENMFSGIITLIIVLLLIMFLFFRNAKTIDYMVLYRRMEEVSKIKDDFLSIATHELRTPLTVIRGYADLLKSSKNIKPEDKKVIDIIDLQSKRLSLLIDDILCVPKLEQGKMDFVFEKFDPKDEIKDTIDSFEYTANEKGLKLINDIQETGIINVDKSKFKQVLINIIGNAVKYTKEGEVKVSTSIEDNVLKIRISDTGIGMSAEEQRGLFQKFYRVKSRETEDIVGTGLGLWITAKFVKEMKGEISVESIKGVGTHFIISFPVVIEKFSE
ncbi:MAG TPA: HAMP domain-containing sensor histidine kinase [Candidatus Pacearchaeota archaeon]|jgi:signal transduction histidine kinase|nr:HAMP domain-containing sensor histidine kinase [Candidatus Pacearchaeota archaeon]